MYILHTNMYVNTVFNLCDLNLASNYYLKVKYKIVNISVASIIILQVRTSLNIHENKCTKLYTINTLP